MLIYGHRGARGEAPENTLAGFRRAIDVGVTRVELDLRLSRDGELVVIHDENVSRTTGARGLVEHLSVAELMHLDARQGGPDWPEPQPVPTMVRVLEEFPELEHLQLEVKPVAAPERARMVERLVALFRDFDLRHRATVTSFDRELLLALRDSAPQVPIGLVSDRGRPEPLELARALGARLLVLHWKLCVEKRLRAAHTLGMQVSAWTVNDEVRVRQLYQLGVDSVVTDYPTRIAAFMRTRPEASVQRSS